MKGVRVFKSILDDNYNIVFDFNSSTSIKYNLDIVDSIDDLLYDKDIQELLDVENPFKQSFTERGFMNITIMLTLDCNFRCPYCFENLKKENVSNNVCKIVDFITNFIVDKNIKHININWFGGEPLLEVKNIEKIYNLVYPICKLRGVTYSSTLTTNGYLLNYATYKKLKDLKVTTFQITIDGVEKIHNKHRYLSNGKGTFKKIISNLENVLKEDTSNTNFIIRTNCSDENLEYMSEYFEFFINKFGKFGNVMADFHEITNFENNCKSEVTDSERVVNLINEFVSIGGNHVPILWRLYSRNSCLAFDRNSFVIFPNGTVSKCSVETGSGNLNLGFIDNYDNIKNKNDSTHYSIYEECNDCDFSSFCKNGDCLVYEEFNKKPICVYFKNFFDRIVEVLERQELIDYTLD